MAMPFIKGGDFFSLLRNEKLLNEKRSQFYISEIILALCNKLKKSLCIKKI